MNLNKNTFDKASDTLFTFQITGLPGVISPDDTSNLVLNCNSTMIPGISVSVVQEHWQGGYTKFAMGNATFDTLSVNFLVDEDLANWKTLFNWVLFCNNNKDKYAVAWDENTVTGILEYYNNYMNKVVMTLKLNHLWCSGVGGIQLTTKTDGAQYLEANAVFEFTNLDLK